MDDIVDIYFWLRENGEAPADAWAHACRSVEEGDAWNVGDGEWEG